MFTVDFTIYGQATDIDEYSPAGSTNQRMVNTTRTRSKDTNKGVQVAAFGSELYLSLSKEAAAKVTKGKFYKFIGTIETSPKGAYLAAADASEVSESECYVLPAWSGVGVVSDRQQREYNGEQQVNMTIAIGKLSERFYSVPEDLQGYAQQDIINCEGSFQRTKGLKLTLLSAKPFQPKKVAAKS
jgi:hypothetical protein